MPGKVGAPPGSNLGNRHAAKPGRDVRDDYFDVIDCEEKAYWLGFLTADGSISERQIDIALQMRDMAHLETLRDAIAPSQTVKVVRSGYARFQINSTQISRALQSLGVTPRKSFTGTAWDGPAELMSHYWRGVFDGDGEISTASRDKDSWTLCLVGNEMIVRSFGAWARQYVTTTAQPHPMHAIWRWRVSGRPLPRRLAVELYGNCHVALPRKLELARILIRTWSERYYRNGSTGKL